jgi:hypothetical protein
MNCTPIVISRRFVCRSFAVELPLFRNRLVASLGVSLQFAAARQQYLIEHLRLAELGDLCETVGFGSLVRMLDVQLVTRVNSQHRSECLEVRATKDLRNSNISASYPKHAVSDRNGEFVD